MILKNIRALRIKKGEIKEKSFYKYESLYNNHIKKAPFLYTKLKEITYTDLKVFYSDLQAENSVSQIEYINDLIKSCFEVAVIDNIMKNNPAKRINFKEQENNTITVLSALEQKIMIDYLYESKYEDEVIRNMILFNFGPEIITQPSMAPYVFELVVVPVIIIVIGIVVMIVRKRRR